MPISVYQTRVRTLGIGYREYSYVELPTALRSYMKLFSDAGWKVFTYIMCRIDPVGWCFPSVNTIGEDLGMSRSKVHRILNELEAIRLNGQPVVMRVHVRFENQEKVNNRYMVLPGREEWDYYTGKLIIVNEDYEELRLENDPDWKALPVEWPEHPGELGGIKIKATPGVKIETTPGVKIDTSKVNTSKANTIINTSFSSNEEKGQAGKVLEFNNKSNSSSLPAETNYPIVTLDEIEPGMEESEPPIPLPPSPQKKKAKEKEHLPLPERDAFDTPKGYYAKLLRAYRVAVEQNKTLVNPENGRPITNIHIAGKVLMELYPDYYRDEHGDSIAPNWGKLGGYISKVGGAEAFVELAFECYSKKFDGDPAAWIYGAYRKKKDKPLSMQERKMAEQKTAQEQAAKADNPYTVLKPGEDYWGRYLATKRWMQSIESDPDSHPLTKDYELIKAAVPVLKAKADEEDARQAS